MKKILLVLFVIFFNTTSYSQLYSKDVQTRIIKYLNEIEKAGFSGSLLVEIDNKKIFSKGYGYRDVKKKLKNKSSTVFSIGSLTKQFTAAAILKLEMQEKLRVTDKITQYFDNVPADKSQITIHHLLRHWSGLTSIVGDDYEPMTEEEFIKRVLNSKLEGKVNEKFIYSNIGYSLLSIIIEKVSKMSYEEFIYKHLLKPSGMNSTGYVRPKFNQKNVANGYKQDTLWGKPNEKNWAKDGPYWSLKGNGGLLSTTEDLYKWHKALMTDNILNKEAKAKMYMPGLNHNENQKRYYGYGWFIDAPENNGPRLVRHAGTNLVFYSNFSRYIDEGMTFIMLSNSYNKEFNAKVNREIAKIVFIKDYMPKTN